MNTKISQLLERYETRIKEGKYVKTFFERVKSLPKRFFKKIQEGGETKQL